jgi:hypothetical protein
VSLGECDLIVDPIAASLRVGERDPQAGELPDLAGVARIHDRLIAIETSLAIADVLLGAISSGSQCGEPAHVCPRSKQKQMGWFQ